MPPADADRDLPLSNDEVATLLAPFARATRIALAVSGGADSLGMLAAVAGWRPAGLSVLVFSVDHRLRPGSGRVAGSVAEAARRLGFDARVLVRRGPAPTGDIEGAARAARYDLLLAACREAGAGHLLLAHQRDDLAESFVMRLKRGAGVFGLAAMRPWLDLGDLVIARPFLPVVRARLAETAKAAELKAFDDPMNGDPRFERARVRTLMPQLAALGLNAEALAAAAVRLADAAEAIEFAAGAFLAAAVEADRFAVAWLDATRFAGEPHAIRLRVLARIVTAVGGDEYAPRHDRLLALHDAILADPSRLKRTLAGTVALGRAGRVAFYREAGRSGLPAIALRRGMRGIWDHRFAFAVAADAPQGLVLAPAPAAAARQGLSGGRPVPAAALAAVPAVLQRGKAVGLPLFSQEFQSDREPPVRVRSILRDRLDRPPLFPQGMARKYPFTVTENGSFA